MGTNSPEEADTAHAEAARVSNSNSDNMSNLRTYTLYRLAGR